MKSKNYLKVFAFTLSLAVLNGCQSPKVLESTVENTSQNYWQNMEQKLAKISVLKEQGRLGFISQNERGSSNYEFILENKDTTLELTSPIGSQIAFLKISQDESSLNFNNQYFKDKDPQVLLNKALGLNLPCDTLNKILLGIPNDDITRDKNGRIIFANIDGYSVKYGQFKVFNGFALPSDLTIKNNQTTVKIKVNKVNEVN